MPRLFFALAAAIIVLATMLPADAAGPAFLDLSASSVKYFSNRFIVTADGNVRLALPDGTVVRGQTFSMDLKLNRYVIAGNVRVDGKPGHLEGAGWAGYPSLDRVFFLPATNDPDGQPDRWTFAGTDYAHPLKGREQPGDAFFLPDLSAEKPWILAHTAKIDPGNNVLFKAARIYTFGVYTPVVNYAVSFTPNPNFAQNAFAGATADLGVPYNASEHAVSALHARYDTLRGAYLSFDQHFVWDKDYAVVSVNPITQLYRQFNLVGYKRFSPKLEARLFYQYNTQGEGVLAQPYAASGFGELQLNAGLRRSGLSLVFDQYNNGLVDPYLSSQEDPTHFVVQHPSNVTFTWNGFENKLADIGATPLLYQLRSGAGVAHNGFGLETFATTPVTTLWSKFVGYQLYTRPIKVDRTGGSIQVRTDKQRQWFDLPHHVDVTTSSATFSRTLARSAFVLAYTVTAAGDYYGARQLEFYPPSTDVQTSPFGTYSGLAAFRGFTVNRNWTALVNFTPNPYFATSLNVRRNYDTPAPAQGLGGQPPWQFTGDVRVRLAKQILMDVQRSYYFNFAAQRWQPQFQLQFSP